MSLVLRVLRRIWWLVCRLFPVQNNKVVFQSYYGRGYGDNPKYVAEALIATGVPIDYVWVTSGPGDHELPDCFRSVEFRSFRYIYEMSTARVWVDNSRKEYCMKKPNQYYMQTWHGSLGLKKSENMVPDKLSPKYIQMAKRDAKQCDVMVSNCDTLTYEYRNFFWYPKGEVMQKGLPRNDRLLTYTADDVARIKARVGVDGNYKLFLYAPTFRADHDLSAYDVDYRRCKEALEKKFGGEWKILLRLHPNVFKLSDNLTFDPDVVVNVSYHPDMQELYMIADMLVTDYSSVIFDFLLLERPSMLYASDISKYREERDYYFEFSELPFLLCETNDELEAAILNFDQAEYLAKIQEFKQLHGFCDTGESSQYAAQWILDKIRKQ